MQEYSYDVDGNRTRDERGEHVFSPRAQQSCGEVPDQAEGDTTRYCFDEFERMVLSRGQGVEQPTRYVYDGLDRRDRKTVEEGGVDRHHDYSYIGTSQLLARETDKDGRRMNYDYDSDGRRQGQQIQDPGRDPASGPLDGCANTDADPDTAGTQTADDCYRSYATDANGSVEGLENEIGGFGDPGGRPDTYLYDPYGESENVGQAGERDDPGLSEGAKDNPFRFQGFYYDAGIKTYDMQARNYRPDIGRFVSQDRYESSQGDQLLTSDPLTQNRYAFAGGNPVNNIEFDGHFFNAAFRSFARGLSRAFRSFGRALTPAPLRRTARPLANTARRAIHNYAVGGNLALASEGARVVAPRLSPLLAINQSRDKTTLDFPDPPKPRNQRDGGFSLKDFTSAAAKDTLVFVGCMRGVSIACEQEVKTTYEQAKETVANPTPANVGIALATAIPFTKGGGRFARTLQQSWGATKGVPQRGEGLVYRRTDLNGGKPYIGQSKSDARFRARQREHARENPFSDFRYEVLGRQNPGAQLERLEEYFIRQLGGPTNLRNPFGGLANRRHQMRDERYFGAGGGY